MYDAIVVGARCAGAPTAMLLARGGAKVLLLDKDRRGTDALSTHYIHQSGIARLAAWGLLDRLKATGCPPIRDYTFDVGDFALTGSPPPLGDVDAAYSPRRDILDELLVEAAEEAGVEVRHGVHVQDGRIPGERAGIVIHSLAEPPGLGSAQASGPGQTGKLSALETKRAGEAPARSIHYVP